jgi:hypothetical protein
MMNPRLVLATVILVALSLGCTSVGARQSKLVSRYIEAHAQLRSDVKAALLNRKVIPGMTEQEVFLSSGIEAQKFRNYSIWVVQQDGTLQLPPLIILPGMPVAIRTKNATQFESGAEQDFVVYFDTNNRVTHVKRWEGN